MLTDLDIECLPQTSVELSEPFLVLLVQEDFFDVAFVLKPLVKLVEKSGLNVAALHFWSSTVPII